jgi:hypothetical protein
MGLGAGGVLFITLGGAGLVSVIGVVLAVIVDPPLPVVIRIPLFHLPIIIIVPPTIHPTGSCLWGCGQVVCRLLPWVVLGWFLLFGVVLMLAVVFPSLSWGHSSLSWGPGACFHHHQ